MLVIITYAKEERFIVDVGAMVFLFDTSTASLVSRNGCAANGELVCITN
jgi:hypothetical protein